MSRITPHFARYTGLILAAVPLCAVLTGGLSADERTIDGTYNNVAHPNWGAASDAAAGRYVQLQRMAQPAYADTIAAPAGASKPVSS